VRKSKRLVLGAALAAAALTVTSCSSSGDSASDRRYVVSVKLIGVGWFDNMEKGISQWATDKGIDATMTGATDASPEKQSRWLKI